MLGEIRVISVLQLGCVVSAWLRLIFLCLRLLARLAPGQLFKKFLKAVQRIFENSSNSEGFSYLCLRVLARLAPGQLVRKEEEGAWITIWLSDSQAVHSETEYRNTFTSQFFLLNFINITWKQNTRLWFKRDSRNYKENQANQVCTTKCKWEIQNIKYLIPSTHTECRIQKM